MAKVKTLPKYEGKMWPIGAYVLIKRPAVLWSGCAGTIETADPKTGIHRVRIAAKDQVQYASGFAADVSGEHLEEMDLLA